MALVGLVASAGLNTALAAYQWIELLAAREGATPACAINDTVNCATVWNTPFAKAVNEAVGLPVAGLGLVWAVTAALLAGGLWWRSRSPGALDSLQWAVATAAAVGTASCLGLAAVSAMAKVVCPTCLGTYALVLLYAGCAWVVRPRARSGAAPGLAGAGATAATVFLAALAVNQPTPPTAASAALKPVSEAETRAYLTNMPEADRGSAVSARDAWQRSPVVDATEFVVRARDGSASAPVAVVEFSDVLCGHCAALEHTLAQVRRAVSAEQMSIESRQFPLDGECNRAVERSAGDGLRCLGAKLQICLEPTPGLWAARRQFFERQAELTKPLMLDIASRASGLSPATLSACVESPQTQALLDDDIRYALKHDIQGTPLLVVNGRVAHPSGPFILALAMNGGDGGTLPFEVPAGGAR